MKLLKAVGYSRVDIENASFEAKSSTCTVAAPYQQFENPVIPYRIIQGQPGTWTLCHMCA